MAVSMAINLKTPMAMVRQGKQAGPCGPTVSWSSGNSSNAELGRSGLYFCKEKQNPSTYDSLLYPQSLPSTWCSLRICIINNEPAYTYWALSFYVPITVFHSQHLNGSAGNFYSCSTQYPLSTFYDQGTELVALGDTSMDKVCHLALRS